MDNTREKLIDLLSYFADGYSVENRHIGDGTKVCEIADHLIANGVTLQEHDCHWATEQAYKNGYEQGKKDALKWIPVSEPPKERGCYLISVKHWLDGKPVTREAFWNGADWLSCYWKKGDRVELTPRVTHWMPLPEPPKGE